MYVEYQLGGVSHRFASKQNVSENERSEWARKEISFAFRAL